jgi:hypothetical protein
LVVPGPDSLEFWGARVALTQAKDGLLHILGEMAKAITKARGEHAPRIEVITIPTDKIREVLGTGGKVIREIVEKTGAKIDISDDGTVKVSSANGESIRAALNWIKSIASDPEVGPRLRGQDEGRNGDCVRRKLNGENAASFLPLLAPARQFRDGINPSLGFVRLPPAAASGLFVAARGVQRPAERHAPASCCDRNQSLSFVSHLGGVHSTPRGLYSSCYLQGNVIADENGFPRDAASHGPFRLRASGYGGHVEARRNAREAPRKPLPQGDREGEMATAPRPSTPRPRRAARPAAAWR